MTHGPEGLNASSPAQARGLASRHAGTNSLRRGSFD